jgi:hypothetical protein
MSEWGDALEAIPVGETVRVTWHYQTGSFPPPDPSTFTGEIIEHHRRSTQIRNGKRSLMLFRGDAILDVDWIS